MKNLITQNKMSTPMNPMNDYQFPKERGNQKTWLVVGIVSGIGLLIIVSTISFAFIAGVVAVFTGGF